MLGVLPGIVGSIQANEAIKFLLGIGDTLVGRLLLIDALRMEFRSLTLEAFKCKQGPCLERNQAVIYRGPFKKVLDDDGHAFERGRRYAVCDKTFRLYQSEPYAGLFEAVEPLEEIPLEDAKPFDCDGTRLRDPRETKGEDYDATTEAVGACGPGDCC